MNGYMIQILIFLAVVAFDLIGPFRNESLMVHPTHVAIILLLAYNSKKGLSVFLSPNFYGVLLGAVGPWIIFLGIIFLVAEIATRSGSDARGGTAMMGMVPIFIGAIMLMISGLTAIFREHPNNFIGSLIFGLKLHNPLELFRVWF